MRLASVVATFCLLGLSGCSWEWHPGHRDAGADDGAVDGASDGASDGATCETECTDGEWTGCVDGDVVTTTCALGCADETRCAAPKPTFWDDAQVARIAESLTDVTVPTGEDWLVETGEDGAPTVRRFTTRIPVASGAFNIADLEGEAVTGLPWGAMDVGPPGDRVTAVVLWVRDFEIAADAQLYVTGKRPVIIAAARNATVRGTLDVGSWTNGADTGVAGAGADVRKTVASVGGNGSLYGTDTKWDTGAGMGGGGGGYATAGGAGPGQNPTPAAPGGESVAAPTTLRGGASGGTGDVVAATFVTAGGLGGGALQLVALGKLSVPSSGVISAGGAGGRGGAARNDVMDLFGKGGGGGGGAGGLVALEASQLNIAGTIAANGGGGGQGARFVTLALADRGGDGLRAVAAPEASGGKTPPNGLSGQPSTTRGGDGSDAEGVAEDGLGIVNQSAGSGGGGGAGFVILRHGGTFMMDGAAVPVVDDVTPVVSADFTP